MVQTVPSELVHCPASAAGPELGTVSHPAITATRTIAKRIRRVCCRFMPDILSARLEPSSLERWKRYVANNFVTEVEEARGPTADAACNTKAKLVEAKLEMVRAAGLFHCGAAVSRVRWIDTRDRFQRDEIDRCLQGGVGPRQGGSRCD